MGQTSRLKLPYPELTEPADVPTDMRELAEAIESGLQLAYAQITSNVTISSTSAASPTTIITLPAVTLDGSTAVRVEVNSAVNLQTGAGYMVISLYDGSTNLGILMYWPGTAGTAISLYRTAPLTPAAGSHTYSIRAYVNAGTGIFTAGPGGSGNDFPAWARVTRA